MNRMRAVSGVIWLASLSFAVRRLHNRHTQAENPGFRKDPPMRRQTEGEPQPPKNRDSRETAEDAMRRRMTRGGSK